MKAKNRSFFNQKLFSFVKCFETQCCKIRAVQEFKTIRILFFILESSLSGNKVNYGLETVVSVLFSNTRTRLLYNEREIFNTARSEAECSIENSEFIVQ